MNRLVVFLGLLLLMVGGGTARAESMLEPPAFKPGLDIRYLAPVNKVALAFGVDYGPLVTEDISLELKYASIFTREDYILFGPKVDVLGVINRMSAKKVPSPDFMTITAGVGFNLTEAFRHQVWISAAIKF